MTEPANDEHYDQEQEVCWDPSVAPGDPDGQTSNTLTLAECNDCTLGRLEAAMKSDARVGLAATHQPGTAPHGSGTLELNLVGLRIKGTTSNKFDDRLVVFYRPVDLASATTVEDADSLTDVDAAAIEAFLASDLAKPLKISGDELPGKPSTDTDARECRVHTGWKVLRYPITTDPGWEKKDPASGVPTGVDGGALAQGRAQLKPGHYSGSHRLGVHHWSRVDGYTAGSQTGDVNIYRGYTGKYLKDKIKGCEGTWEAAFAKYKKKNKTAEPNDAWMLDHLKQQIGTVAEIRNDSLIGAIAGNSLTPRFTLTSTQVPNPKKPDAPPTTKWTLSITGLYVGDTELGDTQVVVLDSKGVFGINLHAAGQSSDDVNNWSEGCQVQKVKANFEQFRALVELSKHARCANRKAGHKDPCASIAHPSLLMEDVVLMHFGNKDEQTAYNAVRRTAPAADLTAKADAVLAARWADGSLDDEFVDALQGKVDGVSFHESPQTGPVADPAPNLTNTLKSGYKAAIQAVVNAHLLPGADNDKLRKKIGVSALQKKLESYTSADIQRDPAVKSAIDTAVAGLAKNVKKKTVLGYKTVTDAVRAAEERSRTACLGKLGTELDRVTTDVADRQKTTIDDIKAKRKDTAANWTAEGFQLCDYLWQCSFKLSYTLAEVDKPLVDEVDARPK